MTALPDRRRTDGPKRRPRKGLFILPSAFTAANIAAGYYAISQSILGGGRRLQPF